MASKTTVYALIIGIDAYREDLVVSGARFPKLAGCINDATDVLDYLKSDPSFDLKPLTLFNQAAKKMAIVDAFYNHLAKATSKDVVFLYYSGHGTCEHADTSVWTDQSNKRLEAIVCHYENKDAGKFLLTDKELRYLIHELYEKTKAHIVTIFDCCHSGDNTRAQVTSNIVERRIDFVFPQRKWEDFIFAKKLAREAFLGKPVNEVLPQGVHVQLSAAESDEPAVEVGGHGVFTSYLLDTLRKSNGKLTYRDLHSRVRNRMRAVFEQKPKLFTPKQASKLELEGFLKKDPVTFGEGVMVFNIKKRAWVLDKGVLHGIEPGVTQVAATVAAGKTVTGSAGTVELDNTLLQFSVEDLGKLDIQQAIPVSVKGLKRHLVKVRLINKNLAFETAEKIADRLSDAKNKDFFTLFEDEKTPADYDLLLWNNLCYITEPGPENWFHPLVQPVAADTPDAADQLETCLLHISRWNYLKNLRNGGQNVLPENLLEVQFYRVEPNGTEKLLKPAKGNVFTIDLDPGSDERDWGGAIKVQVSNRHNANLYVAVAYQTQDFASDTSLLEPATKMIEPGASELLLDDADFKGVIPLQIDPKWYWYNWKKGIDRFKFVFSTSDFAADALNLAGLPEPLHPELEGSRKGSISRKPFSLTGWGSVDYTLIVNNPTFDKNNDKKAQGLLQFTEELEQKGQDISLAHFVQGLYLDTPGFGTQPVVKSKKDHKTKDVLWNLKLGIANRWAKFWRNRRFEDTVKRMPNQPHLLAKGDSWFQHPLVTDIIDYVGRFYPVYCLSAAGDTIRHYLQEADFVREIPKMNPRVLLISGGGNDILAENLRRFLSNQVPANPKPKDFFTPGFDSEMKALFDIYYTLFDYYKVNHPSLHIIVHGYSYLRPVEPKSKKTNWIGKYLDEKNILKEEDRLAVVKYLLDTFNEGLKKIAAKFDRVHYLDLRKVNLRSDQWYDEIHPSDDGYQNVSLQFIKKLNELFANK